MGVSFRLKWSDESKEDLQNLDGSQKKLIRKGLLKIEENGMNTGTKLHGKLMDCNKLKYKKVGLRIVFRQNNDHIEIIEIIVIGKREDSEVYDEAVKRLNR
jgi:mRNA interferase RelE/StbE